MRKMKKINGYLVVRFNDREKRDYPVWSQPAGAHDAYNIGDIVDYGGTLFRSTVDGNVWSPKDYPQGWEIL